MPSTKLPQIGFEAVVRGIDQFSRNVGKVQTGSNKASGSMKGFADQTKSTTSNAKGVGGSLGKLGGIFQSLGNTASSAVPGLANLVSSISSIPGPVGIAIAAVVGISAAILTLGKRGAAVDGVRISFERMAISAGTTADVFLGDLRDASASTITDFDLMRKANLALAGSTDALRKRWLEGLPKLMEIARVQAAATGASVEFLFSSLVDGVKRSSPRLIDNTGIVLSLGEANQQLADDLGITVEALNSEQKSIAILNATLAAGGQIVEASGGSAVTAADKFAAIGSKLTNLFDTVSLAILPLFDVVVTVIGGIIDVFQGLVNFFAPFVEFIAVNIQRVINFIGQLLAPVANVIGGVINGILEFMSNAVRQFVIGAASIGGAIATGLMWAANNLIFPVVIAIATFIADFLSGQSPPPKGPLKDIDQGGANTMSAWLDGFMSVSLDPVSSVAGQVAMLMGNIATFTLDQVESRLAALDAAIQPFEDRLALVESRFNALKEAADLALEALDKQQLKLLDQLNAGDVGAADAIRAIDVQKQKMQEFLDAQESQITNSKIQLAIMKSLQAEERTALEIRQRILESGIIPDTKVKKTKAPAKIKKARAGAGGNEEGELSVGTPQVDFEGIPGFDFLGTLDEEALAAFLEPIANSDQLGEFNDNVSELGVQMKRIAEPIGGLIGNITSALSGIGAELDRVLVQPVIDAVARIASFIGISGEDSLGQNFINVVSNIATWTVGLVEAVIDNFVQPFLEGVGDVVDAVFREGAIQEAFGDMITGIGTWLGGLGNSLVTALVVPFQTAIFDIGQFFMGTGEGLSLMRVLGTIAGSLSVWFGNIFGELSTWLIEPFILALNSIHQFIFGDDEGSLKQRMSAIGTSMGEWVMDVGNSVQVNLVDPVLNVMGAIITWLVDPEGEGFAAAITTFFSGDPGVVGSVAWILAQAVGFFSQVPAAITGALQGVGRAIWNTMAVPIINVLNWVIDKFNDFIEVIESVWEPIRGALQSMGVLAPNVLFPQINRISTDVPGFLSGGDSNAAGENGFTGAATGGLFQGPGMLRVGEKGEELMGIGSASRVGVFPNEFLQAVTALESVLVRALPSASPDSQGGITNNSTTNTNVTFNSATAEEGFRLGLMFRLFGG